MVLKLDKREQFNNISHAIDSTYQTKFNSLVTNYKKLTQLTELGKTKQVF